VEASEPPHLPTKVSVLFAGILYVCVHVDALEGQLTNMSSDHATPGESIPTTANAMNARFMMKPPGILEENATLVPKPSCLSDFHNDW
jgi:hypothetical protein